MIERLNGRTSVLIAIAGLLLVVLVGWLGFVSPQRTEAADLAVKIDQAETQLAVTQALVDGPVLRRSQAELATLRTAIPDQVQMSQILRQLSSASADARVRVLGVTPQPLTTVGAADLIPMTVTLEGRYFGIRRFLESLREQAEIRQDQQVRASGRLFAIDKIEFTGATSDNRSLIQASLALNAFSFSGSAAPAPEATSGADASGVAAQTSAEASGG